MKAKTKRELQCMNYGFKKAVEQRDKEILVIADKFSDFMLKNTGMQGWNRNWKSKKEKTYWEELKQQLTTKEECKVK